MTAQRTGRTIEAMSPADPKYVLVVDDDEAIRALVSDVLRLRGFRVETAADGQQALSKIQAARPDAVVLDLMMPIMDGWTFLERCRTDPLCGGLPVVVMSAYLDSPTTTPALDAQAVVSKPFDMYVLAETVERLLQMPSVEMG